MFEDNTRYSKVDINNNQFSDIEYNTTQNDTTSIKKRLFFQ